MERGSVEEAEPATEENTRATTDADVERIWKAAVMQANGRDERQAALYVSTVRPAMVRFSRAQREKEEEQYVSGQKEVRSCGVEGVEEAVVATADDGAGAKTELDGRDDSEEEKEALCLPGDNTEVGAEVTSEAGGTQVTKDVRDGGVATVSGEAEAKRTLNGRNDSGDEMSMVSTGLDGAEAEAKAASGARCARVRRSVRREGVAAFGGEAESKRTPDDRNDLEADGLELGVPANNSEDGVEETLGASIPQISEGLEGRRGGEEGSAGIGRYGESEQRRATDPAQKPVVDGDVKSSSGDDTDPAPSARFGTAIAHVRSVRRKARLVSKQRRAEVKRARQQHQQTQKKLRNKDVDEAQKAKRQHDAEVALATAAERCQKAGGEGMREPTVGGTARVSLVKHQKQSEGPRQDEAVEYVGTDDGLPTAVMTVDDVRKDVQLDSCARYTIAGTNWMQYGDRVDSAAPVDYVEGIGGFLLDVLGVWSFEMRTVFDEVIRVEACIVAGCTDEFLLGVDFMREHGATMDFSRNEVRYNEEGRVVVIPFRTQEGENNRRIAVVRRVGRTQLQERAVTPVEVSVAAPDGERGVFIPTCSTGAVMLAATVTTAINGKAWVPAINSDNRPARLPNKKELGTWVPVDKDMEVMAMNNGMDPSRLEQWMNELGDAETPLDNEDEVNIGTDVPKDRAMIMRLLRVYRKLSSSTSACPPTTALDLHHHIDTGNAAPIMLKRRRQAQTEDKIIDENVTQMLEAGVIEEGNGAWGFPVVLVRKKDGEVRFCVDYRALNAITKKDVYPLPRIDETLEALGGALLFSTLDLKAGYWQILVAPEDKDKTAFTTKKGLYRFVRMPFGLTNAPSTFQRMMNSVLRGLTWSTCLVYLDDIVVFTRGSMERHVLELANVLERLSAAGLTLKLKKCRFAARSMEYLGHELSHEGVRPLQRLVTAVQEFPRPKDAVEVKRFVHLAGYYRRFVEGFGTLMAPLTKLLRKAVDWEWTPAQESAFEHIKQILTSKPLLVYPDFRRPFQVVTDASRVGLGACLMQDHGSGMQPVAYASKVNNDAEGKYGITELECLAVVWAIKLFRPYLYGRRFQIVTDHAALKWLMTSSNLTGKLHRWALTLQEFDFDVQYRPGSTNVVADALSRAPSVAKVCAAVGRRRRTRKNAKRASKEHVSKRTASEVTMEPRAENALDESIRAAIGEVELDEDVEDDIRELSRVPGRDKAKAAVNGEEGQPRRKEQTPLEEDVESGEQGVVSAGEGVMLPQEPSAVGQKTTRRKRPSVSATGRPVTRAEKRRTEERAQWEAERDERGRTAESESDVVARAPRGATVTAPASANGRRRQDGRRRSPTRAGQARENAALEHAREGLSTATAQAAAAEAVPPRQSEKIVEVAGVAPRKNPGGEGEGATGRTTVTAAPSLIPDDEARQAARSGAQVEAATQGRGEQQGRNGQAEVTARSSGYRTSMDDKLADEQRDARRVMIEKRRQQEPTLQLTDTEIVDAQRKSKLAQQLKNAGVYRGQKVNVQFGLVTIETASGRRIVLPPKLWAVAFKEAHDSVWAGHLRTPHTYARIAQVYWWPGLLREVKNWVRGCQECGSRKARPREVIPALRSLKGGDVGDRWALDVAGPLPQKDGGERFVIAAIEYVTRYAVVATVTRHTAENVADFLMKRIVLKFGPFREILTDGAPELTGYVIEELVELLQAQQTTPVPYRPQMVGLVERFNRTWKDMVATYMNDEQQRDWDQWVDFAAYAYNSGRHSTVALSPNELMMGRKLRSPNELLRAGSRTEAGELTTYHRKLVKNLEECHQHAEQAREREQKRQARYYNRRERHKRTFKVHDRVWMFKPPRGSKASKFVHQWLGPLKIVENAGYDNYVLEREDTETKGERIIAHVSFLVSYHYPADLLRAVAADITEELAYEDSWRPGGDEASRPEAASAAAVPVLTAIPRKVGKRSRDAVARERILGESSGVLVELRRRRRRNSAGRYVLEFELQPAMSLERESTIGDPGQRRECERCWVSLLEYESLFAAGRVVEDSRGGEGV